jgi:ATP-dependent exoDNAse (exonuclease V) beta subunit
VLEKPDELVIVDYKTGSAPRGQALGEYRTELAKFYRGQMKAYAKMVLALPEMQGKRVSAFLLLTQLETDRLVPVELE